MHRRLAVLERYRTGARSGIGRLVDLTDLVVIDGLQERQTAAGSQQAYERVLDLLVGRVPHREFIGGILERRQETLHCASARRQSTADLAADKGNIANPLSRGTDCVHRRLHRAARADDGLHFLADGGERVRRDAVLEPLDRGPAEAQPANQLGDGAAVPENVTDAAQIIWTHGDTPPQMGGPM
jgi:hypothetical protein